SYPTPSHGRPNPLAVGASSSPYPPALVEHGGRSGRHDPPRGSCRVTVACDGGGCGTGPGPPGEPAGGAPHRGPDPPDPQPDAAPGALGHQLPSVNEERRVVDAPWYARQPLGHPDGEQSGERRVVEGVQH